MNPEAPSSSSRPTESARQILSHQFFPHNGGPNIKLLARGAAADVWLYAGPMPSQDDSDPRGRPWEFNPPMKLVSKCVRISPETMIFYRRGRSSQKTKAELWEGFVQDYQNQINRWCTIKHKNVIKMIGFVEEEGLNLIEEFCTHGTVRDRRWPADLNTYDLIHPVVTALRYLHELEPPVVHGNLNADKIYVTDNNVVKLGEFGLARLTQGFATLAPTISHSGICRWMSPELFNNDSEIITTRASDIWALGCTLYEVLFGQLPYSDCRHDIEVVRQIKGGVKPGRRSEQQTSSLSYLWPVIEACWSSAPEERPSSYDILAKIEALTLKEQVRGRGGATDISIDANAPYLDQLHTWTQGLQVELSWEYIRTRLPGRPTWRAMPIVQAVRLTAFVGSGATEAAAQASAAEKLIVFGALNDISE